MTGLTTRALIRWVWTGRARHATPTDNNDDVIDRRHSVYGRHKIASGAEQDDRKTDAGWPLQAIESALRSGQA